MESWEFLFNQSSSDDQYRDELASFAMAADRCDVLQTSPKMTFEKQPKPDGVLTILICYDSISNTTLSEPLRSQLTVHKYNILFPTQPNAFPAYRNESIVGSTNGSSNEQCYLVFFHIKEEAVSDFRNLMMEECATVLAIEPAMLRYDLHQSCEDPCQFLVYEFASNEAGMSKHAKRRADGKMRTTIGTMESRPRNEIRGTGRYELVFPTVEQVQWPCEWRRASHLNSAL
jgi:quinol monooxygenase YgiN